MNSKALFNCINAFNCQLDGRKNFLKVFFRNINVLKLDKGDVDVVVDNLINPILHGIKTFIIYSLYVILYITFRTHQKP